MCVETPGVPPLLPAEERGPTDRIPPGELTPIGGTSVASISLPGMPAAGPVPLVVLCHERYGVVRHTIELADRFADAGFVTVAPDFYADMHLTGDEERLPDVPDDAVLGHLDAAIAHGRGLPGVTSESPVAVIGICRSGSYGILASATRDDVDAVVMLYGGAQQREYETGPLRSTPYEELLAGSTAPVLGLWGERDHTMSVEDVRRVRDLLEGARRTYDFTIYRDMPHGWLNDTMPGRFRSGEADKAFQSMVDWLRHAFDSRGSADTDVTWSFRSRIAADYDFASNERLH
jgi:carboxymethylenebutenolidase